MKRILIIFVALGLAGLALIKAVDRRPSDANAPSYEEALAMTSSLAVPWMPVGGAEEELALGRMKELWADLSVGNVRQNLASVYADDVWFYDTIRTITNLVELEHYMVETAERVDGCSVEFHEVMRTENGYFIRWHMVIDPSIGPENDTWKSWGISHFRFNREGRIILHHDYWDSGQGFYENLPGTRWILRNVRARL